MSTLCCIFPKRVSLKLQHALQDMTLSNALQGFLSESINKNVHFRLFTFLRFLLFCTHIFKYNVTFQWILVTSVMDFVAIV